MNPLISIIVPIYNTEIYLHICIDSILNQTYRDFELLLINDGSTDKSGQICDEYAQNDKRIRVIHKSNTGVSDSRNCGLDIAKGKYVIFIDADDYWSLKTTLEQLINIAEANNLDIIRGEYKTINEKGEILFSRSISPDRLAKSRKIISSYEFLKYAINGEFFLWLCLFKREAINRLRFKSKQIFLEDMRFLSTLITQNVHCMYLPELRFYAYRKNSKSASFTINSLKIKDAFDMCNFFYSLSKKIREGKLKVLYQKMSIHIYYSTLQDLANDEYYINRRKYITDFKLNSKEKKIRKWISEFKLRKDFPSVIYYIPPIIGIFLFRVKHKLVRLRVFLKNNILSSSFRSYKFTN